MSRPMEKVPIPSADDIRLKMPGPESWEDVCARRQAAKEQIKRLEKVVEEADQLIGPTLDLNQLKNIVWNGYVVSRREESHVARLDTDWARTKLLEMGVSPHEIAQHTATSTRRAGVSFRLTKEGAPEEDEQPN